MDSIFGIGLPELVLIAIIAGIVMGPERIVVGARWLGRTTGKLQGVSRSFFRQLNAEIDGIDQSGDIKETLAELNQLRRQVDELRAEFVGIATTTGAEVKQTMAQLEADTIGSMAPPSLLSSQKPVTNGGAEVYRPPSLLQPSLQSNGNIAPQPPAVALPKRQEAMDDPE